MDLTGKVVGPYQIDREIGRGGMSTIYHAVDTRSQQGVALKVLLPHLTHDPITLRRFQQEGENARRMIHPNIVRVFEAGVSDGYYYIAMEYASGGTVATLLKERTHPMNVPEAAAILRRVAAALDYAHKRGILHRDIKPSNVLIGGNGQVLLSDFGVARHMATDQTVITLAGYSVGTPAYMSPEQARGDFDLDARADIYSLGVVAYAMLTHALPFDADSQLVLLRKIIDEPPVPPEQVNAALPAGVVYALQRVLAKRPEQRYATAGEFVEALERGLTWVPTRRDWTALAQSPQPEAKPTKQTGKTSSAYSLSTPPPARPQRSRGRAGLIALLLGLVALLLVAFLLLTPGNDAFGLLGMFNELQPQATPVDNEQPIVLATAPMLPTATPPATPTVEPTAPPLPPTLAPTPVILSLITEAALEVQLPAPEGWQRRERNGAIYFEAPDRLAWLFIDRWQPASPITNAQTLLTTYLTEADTLLHTSTVGSEGNRLVGDITGYEQHTSGTLIGGAPAVVRLLALIDDERYFVLGLSSEPAQAIVYDQLYESILRGLRLLPVATPTSAPTVTTTATSAPTATPSPLPSPTATPPPPTATPSPSPATTATVPRAPTATATTTIRRTSTPTNAPTSTPRPTTTPNSKGTATAQAHLVATSVAKTLTALPTATRQPSATPTPLPSPTATPRATDTATVRPTSTPIPVNTATATPDLLLTLTAIDQQLTALAPFLTPEIVATATPVATATATTVAPATPTVVNTTTVASAPSAPAQPAQAGLITGFESFGRWQRGDEPHGTLAQSTSQLAEGTFAAELKYNFPAAAGNRNYVVFQPAPALPIEGNPAALQLAVYGDGAGHYLNIWVGDAANHIWQFTFGQLRHVGWATLTAPLSLVQPWPVGSISGGDTAQLTPPLTIRALVLDGVPDGVESNGVIYLDALGTSADAVTTSPPPAVPAAADTPTAAPADPQAPPPTAEANSAPPINTGALTGRIAYSVFNGQTMDVLVYNLADGNRWRLANKRQPDFSRGGVLMVNGDGGGVNDVVRITQNGEEGVTAHPEDSHAQWSKSSQSVVYASTHQGDGKSRIYWQRDASARFDSPPMSYSGRELFGKYPVYLDNWRIAYQGCNFWAGGSACGIYTADTNGGQPGRATDLTSDIPSDSLGDRILFTANREGNWDVYVVNTDGSGLTRLTDHPGRDGLATTSPDFQHIAFVSDRDGAWAVYVMNVDGSNQQKLFALDGGYGGGNYEWYEERLSWGP
jgi:serine/threonine-protein kinase